MTTDTKTFKQTMLEWFEDERTDDRPLHETAQRVIDRIVKSSFADQALLAMGPEMLVYFWRTNAGRERRDAVTPGRRRFDLETLKDESSMFDILVHVEGTTWRPFGDLTRKECGMIASSYLKREIGNRKWRLFYERLQTSLKNGEELVRQAFTPDQIRSLFAEQGVSENELT